MSESVDEAPRSSGNLALGIFIALLLQVLQVPLIYAIPYAVCLIAPGFGGDECGLSAIFLAFGAWGVTQLVYMAPALLIARVKAGPETVKGMLIGAGLVFLLGAACWGLVFRPF